MAVEIERYIVELGTEGRLIEMQLEETMVGVAADRAALVHDYIVDPSDDRSPWCSTSSRACRTKTCWTSAAWPSCSATTARSTRLTSPSRPAGYRILGRIPRLPKLLVQRIVREFGRPRGDPGRDRRELETVEGVGEIRAKDIREGLRRLQEINLVDRYLQT